MYDETLCMEIIRNNVNSTKKWFRHYLLEDMFKTLGTFGESKLYSLSKKYVEDVYVFKNEILNKICENKEKVVIGKQSIEFIKRVTRKEIVEEIIKQIEAEITFSKYAGMAFDNTIEKILTIIRGQ